MKKLLFLLCIIFVFALCSCISQDSSQTEGQSPGLLGKAEENTYTNEIIGFSATIPEGWKVADIQQMSRFFGASQDDMEGATSMEPEGRAFIFFCSKYVYGYEGSNPGVGIQVSTQAAIKSLLTSEDALNDYIEQSRSAIEEQYGDTEAELSGEMGVQIGGNEYSAIYINASFNGSPIIQDVYFLGIGDYVLMITETYSDESEKSEADTFLESLKVG